MTENTRNALFRISILCLAVGLAFGILFVIWGNLNPEMTIPWLNLIVSFGGLLIAYLSIPEKSKISSASYSDWILVVVSLVVAVLSLALSGLNFDWLKALSNYQLLGVYLACCIGLFSIYGFTRMARRLVFGR